MRAINPSVGTPSKRVAEPRSASGANHAENT